VQPAGGATKRKERGAPGQGILVPQKKKERGSWLIPGEGGRERLPFFSLGGSKRAVHTQTNCRPRAIARLREEKNKDTLRRTQESKSEVFLQPKEGKKKGMKKSPGEG